jgi:hypothetical protein
LRGTSGLERVANLIEVCLRHVNAKEQGAMLDFLLDGFCPDFRDTRAAQYSGDSTGSVSGSLPEIGGERPGCDDRADTRHDERNGGQRHTAELPESRSGTRILDVGAGRRVHLLGQRPFLVVRTGNDREVLALNAEAV